jgi:hypothetical protein
MAVVAFYATLQEEEEKKKKAYLGPTWVPLRLQAPNFGSSPPSSKLLKLVLQALAPPPSFKLLKLVLQAPARPSSSSSSSSKL